MRAALAGFGALVVLAVIAFATFQPIKVLPRIRLAPGFVLTDQHGTTLTSEDLRGSVTLYTFTYGRCEPPCYDLDTQMAEIARRVRTEADLGDTPFRLVTISFDPEHDTPEVLTEMAAAAGADGEVWRFATGDPATLKNVIGGGFKTYYERLDDGTFRFDPAFVLVDGWGVIRGEYEYRTLASTTDRIVRHVGILGEELRKSKGAASVAFEAAHFFLCYP